MHRDVLRFLANKSGKILASSEPALDGEVALRGGARVALSLFTVISDPLCVSPDATSLSLPFCLPIPPRGQDHEGLLDHEDPLDHLARKA